MNRKILQKVIDELNKENPKLDYIRGILEILIEGLPEESAYINPPKDTIKMTRYVVATPSEESLEKINIASAAFGENNNEIIDPILALETGLSSKIKGIQKAEIE